MMRVLAFSVLVTMMFRRLYINNLLRGSLLKSYLSSTGISVRSKVCFTGIQPTGVPHIGNYFGSILECVNIQRQSEWKQIYVCVVDLHAITSAYQPATLHNNIFKMAACLLACGIDPEKVILFQQSQVAEHCQLQWLLSTFETVSRLRNMPKYKELSNSHGQFPLGMFLYPVLQASDILLYRTTHVPVGDDQAQHIELTRDLARVFNARHGKFFAIPEQLKGSAARIKDLRYTELKMSKSDPSARGRIDLTDDADEIRHKIRKAKTDQSSAMTYDPVKRPGVSNLLEIYAAVSGQSIAAICDEVKALDTLAMKDRLADALIAHLEPIQKSYKRLLSDPAFVWKTLADGSNRARQVAHANITKIYSLIGFAEQPSPPSPSMVA